jgi:2-polyprenyl-6-methoxyphenol hydroxylase-like FAD-dependent oxidoreductase
MPMASGIGIVGYGTAGQALALQLARVGQSVTVYERVSEPGPVGAERGTLRDAAGREHGPHALLILADGAASRLRAAQDTRRNRPYRWGAVWGLLPTPAGWPLDRLEQRYGDTRRMAGLLPVGRLPGEAPDVYRLCFYWSAPAAELDGLCAAGVDAVMPDLPAAVAGGRGCAEVPRGYDRTARRPLPRCGQSQSG